MAKTRVLFPIRFKLWLLMGILTLAATGAYLFLAIQTLKEDKTELVYELNANTVKTLAAEIDATLLKFIDKLKLLTQGYNDSHWIHAVLASESDLIAYTLYQWNGQENGDNVKIISSIRNSEYFKVYGLSVSEIDRMRKQIPIPFDQVLAKKIWISNSTLEKGAPVLTLAVWVEIKQKENVSGYSIAVIDLRMDKLLRLISSRKIGVAYVVDTDGKVVMHPDPEILTRRTLLTDIPLVRDAIRSPIDFQMKPFHWQNQRWLGAYSYVSSGGLWILAQVPEHQVFAAIERLIRRTALFGLLVLTCSLLISGWMSNSFTTPLRKLLQATEKMARWEATETLHVKTRDEIASLARAFNAMATDLKTQRDQINLHQIDLERKVQERTADLVNEKKKLFEAQDALLRTTKLASLGELAGAAAHEVLNPVNNMNIRVERMNKVIETAEKQDVALMSQILLSWKESYQKGGWQGLQAELEKPTNVEARTLGQEDLENLTAIIHDIEKRVQQRQDDFAFLVNEMTRITKIINNMRSLSRVGGERRPLDVHLPVEETLVTLGDLLQKKGVQLVKDFSAESRDLFTMIGDKDELVQVFSNLIRNAVQAISGQKDSSKPGVIRVTTRRTPDRIEVRVSDNGPGIKKEYLSRLFESNFTTKTAEEGTGLGLSICRRLVRAFSGDIELESTQEGEGTTFLVWFPFAS